MQTTAQSHGDRNVVKRTGRLEFMKEPQTLLRKREWEFFLARDTNDRRSLFARSVAQSGFDACGQIPDGRRFKQAAHRQLHSEAFTHTRDEPRRKQGMSAEREKVVAHANALNPEHFRPKTRKQLFDRSFRPDKILLRSSLVGRR